MNGWNGLPGVAGLTGAVGPLSMGGYGGGYMTPPGGQEILSPITPQSITPLSTFAPTVTPPAGSQGWFGIDGLGKNLNTLQMGLGTIAGFANLWNGFQQNKLARQAFNHQKGILDTNLANQIKSFNLQLDDKLRSRQVVEGTSDAAREEARRRWEARDERRS